MMRQLARSAFRQTAQRVPVLRTLQFHSSPFAQARVLCSDPIDPVCVDILKSNGHQVDQPGKLTVPELLEMIGEYEGLVVRSGTKVTQEVLDHATNLKIIGRAGTGVDNIDVPAATKKGILVMNTPGGNTVSTAEHSMALITSLARSLPQAVAAVKSGDWERELSGTELSGKTLGVVGLGKIGREVAKWAQAMGMTVIGYDPILSQEVAAAAGIDPVSLDGVWERSDFITLHTPLTPDTRNLINAEVLGRCRRGVRIVNCARGGIIDEAALLDALQSGQCGGVALDVYSSEPPPESTQPLLHHPNVIATPHLGASTSEAQVNVARAIAVQFSEAFSNTRFHGVLNAPSVHVARRTDMMPFMALAEQLGSIQAQLLGSAKLQRVAFTYQGADISAPDLSSALTSGALRGLLTQVLADDVNLVNAPALAKDLGLEISEQRESSSPSYANTLTLTFHTDAGTRSISGTVFGHSQPRIVAVDGFEVDIAPAGTMLFFNNEDRPGVLNAIISTLAAHGVNIANFGLGRHEPGAQALGIVCTDAPLTAAVLSDLSAVANICNVAAVRCPEVDTSLPMLYVQDQVSVSSTASLPAVRPASPHFSSGPCKKRPQWALNALSAAAVGRSHRSSLGKQKLAQAIDKTKELLAIPEDYHVGIVPASDTGAFEMGMWSLLGPRPVDVAYWESFGKGWMGDCKTQLKLDNVTEFTAPYGQLPDLAATNPDHDIVFTWNGTTSGVKVPNGDWISESRGGLTLCDATSAVFAMELPWEKLDFTTYSWQKVLGGEGGHGMVILSPRAVERLTSYTPAWPLPKIFRMTKGGKLDAALFKGSTINTPSMLCVEDYLDALEWAEGVGGLQGLVQRSEGNLSVLEQFVADNDWIDFLAQDKAVRSNTSICLVLNGLEGSQMKAFTALLERENVAFDIGAYRDAPDGLRIWGGATVERSDLEALLPWLSWAYDTVTAAAEEGGGQ